MTITFGYYFNSFFLIDLVEAIFFVLMYLMIFLDSRSELRENISSQILERKSVIGMILSVTLIVSPTLVCTNCNQGEYYMAFFYSLGINILYYFPMLLCLGVGLCFLGKKNKESFGNFLFLAGIFWILAFFGFIAGSFMGLLVALNIDLIIIFSVIAVLNSFALPALILMFVHGVKFKDKKIILTAVFFILSIYLPPFMAWIPLPI